MQTATDFRFSFIFGGVIYCDEPNNKTGSSDLKQHRLILHATKTITIHTFRLEHKKGYLVLVLASQVGLQIKSFGSTQKLHKGPTLPTQKVGKVPRSFQK